MAKYDFTNETPFNEQPLYKQGYEDAIEKACEFLKEQTFQEYPGAPHERLFDDYDINEFRKAIEQYELKYN